MKNIVRISICIVIVLSITLSSFAERYKGDSERKSNIAQKVAGCVPASGSSYLEVNNVRAYIETSGSMWFASSVAQYTIPKEGGASSMFAAALWIGGKDIAGQLKLAAVRFRQVGDDFWPGPLTIAGQSKASIEEATCRLYDKHFRMTKKMAQEHKDKWNDPDYTTPEAILNWPGNPVDGNTEQSWFIAPYEDVDGDGNYTPLNGDYPYYDFDNALCPWTDQNRLLAARDELPKTYEEEAGISFGGILADQVLKGDETLWWIFNDKGNTHTETKGSAIGLEIRAQAFGFATTDELNNMTFYSYEIINRSSFSLTETYFSQWVDPDLGYAQDDFIGCDVERGLGYCYNGEYVDGTGLNTHYGANPPAVGVDFFQGPYLDADGYDNPSYKGDNVHGPSFASNYANVCEIVTQSGNMMSFTWDSVGTIKVNGEDVDSTFKVTRQVKVLAEAINGVNFGDGIVDNERYGMRRFVYHNNASGSDAIRDPSIAIDYYNLLRGIWKDNSRMRYGGTGYHPNDDTRPECDFMFPGSSDPCNWGTKGINPNLAWTEKDENNSPGDRRFMQSAGPFTLEAGAINYITVGIPWARAASGDPYASVELLKLADDKAQTLFENCFVSLEGPDAPDLAFREMDKRIIFYISNSKSSNNYNEGYEELDPTIPKQRIASVTKPDTIYVPILETLTDRFGNDSIVIQGYDTVGRYIQGYDTLPDPNEEYNRYYRFEGYQIYQLVNASVSSAELNETSKAQLVFQCDIKNGVAQVVNHEYNAVVGTDVPAEKVDGADKGISHSFVITEDKFASGSSSTALVNHKKYYYMAVAYAYNNYEQYSTVAENSNLYGQKTPYLMGSKNVQLYTVIPHVPYMEENGIVPQSEYGSQPQITQLEGQGNGGFEVRLERQTISEILANGKTDSLIFQKNYGPIGVKVVDPLKVVGADFILRFVDTTNNVTKNTRWQLEYVSPFTGLDTVVESETTISVLNEQFLLDFGISLTIYDARFSPLADNINADDPNAYRMFCSVDFISSSVTFNNPASPWIYGLGDVDGSALNWMRGGTTKNGDWRYNNNGRPITSGEKQKYGQVRLEDYYYKIGTMSAAVLGNYILDYDGRTPQFDAWLDKNKQFAQVGNGWWSPYALASIFDNGPAYGYETRESEFDEEDIFDNVLAVRPNYGNYGLIAQEVLGSYSNFMTELYSVDIVLTSDKSLWTRCPVIEISDDPATSIGGAKRHELRKSLSVDKEGKPLGTDYGMGWFPGYAICVETGERLNVMFGENSSLPGHNGADMIFNPSSYLSDASGYVLGGGHYIYILGHQDLFLKNVSNTVDTISNICPSYKGNGDGDGGEWVKGRLEIIESSTNKPLQKMQFYKNVMWTGIPLANSSYNTWLQEGNDVTISIRVSRPYQRWSSTTNTSVSDPKNNNLPLYKFSTKGLETLKNQRHIAENYMDSIYVTPNPYYGMAQAYESSQLDTRVKFINLPNTCDIKIFTLDGTLIRTLKKPDDGTTYYEWDLKNSANIPIASGMYLIHIRSTKGNSGVDYNFEKTLKFLCIQRPVDVNAF